MRNRREVLVTCVGSIGVCLGARSVGAGPQAPVAAMGRSTAFWTSIVDTGFAIPPGLAPIDLLLELGQHFGSPDPVLRDRAGYGITARWVVREKRLTNPELQRLASAWMPGLLSDHDPHGGDVVLRRSFSALGLSLVVAADLEQRALDAATVDGLVSRASQQLRTNTDRRGFEPALGWVHVIAHTADLLKFLGRHPLLTAAHERLILDSVSATVASAPAVFQWGEDERLSRAAASVLRRDDVQTAVVDQFLNALKGLGSRVDWDQPTANGGLAPMLNAKSVLKDLHLVLTVAGKDEMRTRVLDVLQAIG